MLAIMKSVDATLPRITVDGFRQISDERLPFAHAMGIVAERIEADYTLARAVYRDDFLRPGGTIAGPIMMGLGDAALYALVLSRVGPVELAVTTQFSINFLRKPEPGDVLAEARALKVGRRLVVGEVLMWSESRGREYAVAHATGTYSIPPGQ